MRELDARVLGQVGGRPSALDKHGQARDVVGLDVRLEGGDDRGSDRSGSLEVGVDQLAVRVDDRELVLEGTAEQITRTGGVARRGTDAGSCVQGRRLD